LERHLSAVERPVGEVSFTGRSYFIGVTNDQDGVCAYHALFERDESAQVVQALRFAYGGGAREARLSQGFSVAGIEALFSGGGTSRAKMQETVYEVIDGMVFVPKNQTSTREVVLRLSRERTNGVCE